jgi:regulator of sigma E protease
VGNLEIASLVTSLGGGLQALVALLVVLAVVVSVHEYGHYIVGRWCGIHAEVFSLGFGRPIWSRFDRRGTRWQIAAIPVGGFVRFLGDADAASRPGAIEGLTAEERRHTMPGAPLWARVLTVAAGPAFNVVLAVVMAVGLILWSGVQEDAPVIAGAAQVGQAENPFQPGDRILQIAGRDTPDFATLASIAHEVQDQTAVAYRVQRGDQVLDFTGPNPFPPMIASVLPRSAAEAAGLQPGDLVLTVGGKPIAGFDQMPPFVAAAEGAPVALTVQRGSEVMVLNLTPARFDLPTAEGGFETRWLIGINGQLIFEPQRRQPGFGEAVSLAFERTWLVIKLNFNGIVQMVAGSISTCNLSSPIGMAKVASAAASSGPEAFLGTLALMSLGIGLANLLPIPVLDGGHLLFHLYEAVARRKPHARAQQALMTLGLLVLLGLMLFAASNDLFLCA